jgi:hypothetical protein
VSTPIGDGYGTHGGCRLGCAIALVGLFVVLAVAAVFGAGLAALTTPHPKPSTSTGSTP